MFERSQQEAFGDAWTALKSAFSRDTDPDPAGEVTTLLQTLESDSEPDVGVFAVPHGKLPYTFESGRAPMHFFCTTF